MELAYQLATGSLLVLLGSILLARPSAFDLLDEALHFAKWGPNYESRIEPGNVRAHVEDQKIIRRIVPLGMILIGTVAIGTGIASWT